MPRVARRQRPEPDGLFMAWQSFAAADIDLVQHPGGVVRKGTLLRGSDPHVVAHPEMFVPAGEVVDEKVDPATIQSRREAAGAA
jgi:hypothetical protein